MPRQLGSKAELKDFCNILFSVDPSLRESIELACEKEPECKAHMDEMDNHFRKDKPKRNEEVLEADEEGAEVEDEESAAEQANASAGTRNKVQYTLFDAVLLELFESSREEYTPITKRLEKFCNAIIYVGEGATPTRACDHLRDAVNIFKALEDIFNSGIDQDVKGMTTKLKHLRFLLALRGVVVWVHTTGITKKQAQFFEYLKISALGKDFILNTNDGVSTSFVGPAAAYHPKKAPNDKRMKMLGAYLLLVDMKKYCRLSKEEKTVLIKKWANFSTRLPESFENELKQLIAVRKAQGEAFVFPLAQLSEQQKKQLQEVEEDLNFSLEGLNLDEADQEEEVLYFSEEEEVLNSSEEEFDSNHPIWKSYF